MITNGVSARGICDIVNDHSGGAVNTVECTDACFASRPELKATWKAVEQAASKLRAVVACVQPPSIKYPCAVMKLASSDARNAIKFATSCDSPSLPIACPEDRAAQAKHISGVARTQVGRRAQRKGTSRRVTS